MSDSDKINTAVKKHWLKAIISTLLLIVLVTLGIACTQKLSKKTDLKPLNIARANINETSVISLEKEYRKSRSGLKSTIINLDYNKALKALLGGSIDLFIGSIEIPSTLEDSVKKIPIAKDGVVLVVNPANKIKNLDKDQVISIFTGVSSSWKALNDENKPVMVVDRNPSSLEKRTFAKYIFGRSSPQASRFVTVDNVSEVRETLAKFSNAISYVNYSELDQSMKPLSFETIAPTESNISQGYYPLSRNLYLYYNPERLKKNGRFSSFKEFAALIRSAKGQELLAKSGLIPLSEAELEIASIENEPVYIGVAAPKTDQYAELGRSIINGAKLVEMEINKAGGIDGKPVELIICDDKSDSHNAVKCASKFVEAGVLGVIGHLNSQASIEASKIYAKNNTVQISPASSHPWYTERPGSKGFVFRTCGRDDQEASIIASAIKNSPVPHPLKISIFNNGTFHGSTLSALVEDEINNYGVDKIVDIKSIKKGQQQYFNEIQDLDTDVLVFVGEYGDAATIIKALALNNRSDVIFYGTDGTYSQRLIDEAGLRSEGVYVIGGTVNPQSKAFKDFSDLYKDTFKIEANAFAMNSYDATKLLIAAIENAKLKHPVMVAREVAGISFNGVTGPISFDEKGDSILPRVALYKVIDGKFIKQ